MIDTRRLKGQKSNQNIFPCFFSIRVPATIISFRRNRERTNSAASIGFLIDNNTRDDGTTRALRVPDPADHHRPKEWKAERNWLKLSIKKTDGWYELDNRPAFLGRR
jgi:hypothetical protein